VRRLILLLAVLAALALPVGARAAAAVDVAAAELALTVRYQAARLADVEAELARVRAENARLRVQTANLGAKVRAERTQKRWWRDLAAARRPAATGIVAVGLELQAAGYRVAEHPAFGGVHPVHHGAGHYEGRAIDVNCDGCPGGEPAALDRAAATLAGRGLLILWRTDGHYDHLHAEVPR
jgi:hypothetical protein